MKDLEKDQAIYQAMLAIANDVFTNAVENYEPLRETLKDGKVSLKEILKRNSEVYGKINAATPFDKDTKEGIRTITVDTFSCEFPPMEVFNLLVTWKTLAKVKGDIIFTYEEKISNKYIGSIDMTFNNPTGAKNLAKFTDDREGIRPILGCVLVEVNTKSFDINIVSSDGATLGVISNNIASAWCDPKDENANYQALFEAKDWQRICDYAKANGSVTFKLYKREEGQNQDTMVAILGSTSVKSVLEQVEYPNWRKVLPTNTDKHFAIHSEDVKAAQKWVKSIKLTDSYDKQRRNIKVSFYRGSEYVYFDYVDLDFGTSRTAAFRLTKPSEITIGTCYNIYRLQQLKFRGFHLHDTCGATIIDTDWADLLLQMPMYVEQEGDCLTDVENREVVEQLVEVA